MSSTVKLRVASCQLHSADRDDTLVVHGRSNAGRRVGMLTGATIRKYRELSGLSQRELGKRVGVCRQAVCNGETGATQSPHWFPLAARELGIPDEDDTTDMTEDEILLRLSELADLLLSRRSEQREQRPPTYGPYGVGRPAVRSA